MAGGSGGPGRRRGRLGRRLAILAILLGAAVLVDQAARVWTEGKLRERAAAFYPPTTSADADIRSFPFLGRLASSGRVNYVALSLRGIQATDVLRLQRLTLIVRQAELDRGELLRRRVRLVSIGSGRIEALIEGPSLARALGVELRLRPGEATVRRQVAGQDVSATVVVSVEGNRVNLRPVAVTGGVGGVSPGLLSFSYPLPESLLPCRPDVRVVAEGVLVACEVDVLPPGFSGDRLAAPSPSR